MVTAITEIEDGAPVYRRSVVRLSFPERVLRTAAGTEQVYRREERDPSGAVLRYVEARVPNDDLAEELTRVWLQATVGQSVTGHVNLSNYDSHLHSGSAYKEVDGYTMCFWEDSDEIVNGELYEYSTYVCYSFGDTGGGGGPGGSGSGGDGSGGSGGNSGGGGSGGGGAGSGGMPTSPPPPNSSAPPGVDQEWYDHLNDAEKRLVWERGLLEVDKVRAASQTAKQWSGGIYPRMNPEGTPRDALRHARWAAEMAWEIGYNAAKLWLDAHEDGMLSVNYWSTIMDYHNNQAGLDVGYWAAGRYEDIPMLILHARDTGDLWLWRCRELESRTGCGSGGGALE